MFAHSFIPIGLAYLFAHYFSLVLFQEQAQFTYLLSDPLGEGSDFFGTAGSGIDYGLIGAEAVWYVQVAALVIGHVAALAMGHDKALAEYKDLRRATQSQYWMLALMVSFTVLGPDAALERQFVAAPRPQGSTGRALTAAFRPGALRTR